MVGLPITIWGWLGIGLLTLAVVLGSISILGGRGSYVGPIAGAILLTLVISLLTSLSVGARTREALEGLLILALVAVYGRERPT